MIGSSYSTLPVGCNARQPQLHPNQWGAIANIASFLTFLKLNKMAHT